MVAFSVDPQALYDYAGQFAASGAQWPAVVTALEASNLPPEAFGSDPNPFARIVAPTSNIFGGSAQPGLYNAYHALWQKYLTLASAAQQTLDGWSTALNDVGLYYHDTDQTQAGNAKQVHTP
jgi:hypothetical protein